MSVGFPSDKAAIDQRVGSLVLNLRVTLDQCGTVKAWLDSQQPDSALTALGYTAGEVTILRAAFTDLDNLRKLAHAQATQPAANDFFFNAGKLTGLQ
jgi:hypothetical protein